MPAFIYILTNSADTVEVVARLTLTAVGANHVDTTMSFTDLFRALALININAASALFIEVVSPSTVDRVPLADVGPHSVDAALSPLAWTILAHTFIDINAVAQSILDKTHCTFNFGKTAE